MDTSKRRSSDDLTSTNDSSTEMPTTDSQSVCSLPSKKKQRGKETKYDLPEDLKLQLELYPEVLDFIKMLQKCIEKQKKKLKKHKKEKKKAVTISTQTESGPITEASQIEERTKTVTEEITEAAQQALQHNGFVYEETSGLYYDYNSGYYYNAEYGLYYDGNAGTYLKYNQDTKEYEFHSQTDVQLPHASQTKNKHKKRQKYKQDDQHVNTHSNCTLDELTCSFDALNVSTLRRHACDDADSRRKKNRIAMPAGDELEDGECSNLSETTSPSSSDDNESDLDIAKQYPPCMRIIIEETSIPSLKQGSLHLMTFEGGTIGREGTHALLLSEINTSKHHAKISYDAEKSAYFLVDVGSRNGTVLNGKRLSSAKVESEPHEIAHGSRVQIGSTTLLCHVHSGSQTCGHCEPGLLQMTAGREDVGQRDESTKSNDHKHQLKQLRKKFGLSQNDIGKTNPGSGYKDRAQQRRVTVGSQNPHEKTQSASLTESIASDNKGFKMLAKLGWKEGQALGKNNQGLLEPVELHSNPGTSGMGATNDNTVIQPSPDFAPPPRPANPHWAKAQERYKQAENHHATGDDIFDLTDI